MKLLIVGSDEIYSIENFYVKYLRAEGVVVELYTAQKTFYEYYQAGIVNKLLYRAGLSGVLQEINAGFKAAVEAFGPEVIWVFKGMEILPASLQWAKERGISLVNFNGDSPLLFSGKGSGNAHVTKSIGLYDLHLTYSLGIQQTLMEQYQLPVALLPFGYDVDEDVYRAAAAAEEVISLCFMGNPDKERGAFLQELAGRGIAMDLYGNGWPKFVDGKQVNCYPAVYGAEGWKVLRRYRVQLNMMRPHNPDSHNMRTFELGGIGAIQLAPGTADHRLYFAEEKEIFIYNNVAECAVQANKLLAMNREAADAVRAAARNRCEKDGYDYRHRALQVLAIMEEQFG